MRNLLILIILTLTSQLYAQNFVSIEGYIQDAEDDNPVAYSHVIIKDSGTGTVANEDGQFIFKIPISRMQDSIQFSAIGYKSESLLVTDIKDRSNVLIKLSPESKILDEVLITPIDPRALIKTLANNIPANYGTSATKLTGFYRETVKINDQFYSYLEGVIEAYKTGYDNQSIKSDQVKIIKGRRRENKIIQDSTRLPPNINSGPLTIHSYDLIKRRANFINAKKSKFYTYELTDITTYNGKDIYVVDFKATKPSKKAVAFGKLYIDIDTKALLRADYQFNAAGVEALNKNVTNGKGSNFIVTAKSLQVVVDYEIPKGKGLINQLRIKMGFDYYIKSLALTDYMEINLHLITTASQRGNLPPFTKAEIFRSKRAFANYLGEEDPNFWENYNILKQDKRLKEVFDN